MATAVGYIQEVSMLSITNTVLVANAEGYTEVYGQICHRRLEAVTNICRSHWDILYVTNFFNSISSEPAEGKVIFYYFNRRNIRKRLLYEVQ